MKVTIIFIGKTEKSFIDEGIEKYTARLKHYIKIEWFTLPSVKGKGSVSKSLLINKEGEILLSKLKSTDFVILCDEKGSELTSLGLASYISRLMISETHLVLIIGGTYGVSEAVRSRANFILALSQMTFPHQLIRLFLAEQLYRAMTIIKGEKYHHE